ncbi:hypothetical protein [Haloferula sp. BvORR071]|uniref:hypothetical protein n=1 Tax=Haloferula sp. BvORR071 TaxID=1396141 RepID=UPI0005532620|nr:hypothetical protein [Haloferula sp. BvORR071]
MKFTLCIIALGATGFAVGFFPGENPAAAHGAAAKSASVRLDSVLRGGDSAHALDALRKLAENDPRAFFKELEHFPQLDGLNDLVAIAARKLAAGNPADAAKLLNQISNLQFRLTAWLGFVKAVDLTLPEKIALARPAWHEVTLKAVLRPGLETDPEGTLKALHQQEMIPFYRTALGELGKTHPADVIAKLKADFASGFLKPNDGSWILGMMTQDRTSPEVLNAVAGMIRDHGWGEGLYSGQIFRTAFLLADSTARPQVLDAIDTLPAVQKNFALSQIQLDACADAGLALRILNSMDSTELQIAALSQLKTSRAGPKMIEAVVAGIASERTRALWQETMSQGSEK